MAGSILLLIIVVLLVAGLPLPVAIPVVIVVAVYLIYVEIGRRSRKRAATMPKHFEGPYRVYTKDYDREIRAADLPLLLFHQQRHVFKEHTPVDVLDAWADACDPAVQAAARQIILSDVVVTLLLDQSGSLRGEKSCVLATAAGAVSDCLLAAQVRHEILGFTTITWRGGASKRTWLANRAPRAPGRLCDLLHIIYRSADEATPLTAQAIKQMTDDQLLKENVDGEALQWASQRLHNLNAARRILIVVSDGAPVDDSTLLANGPNILNDHLQMVTAEIIAAGDIELYGVGLAYRMDRYYPQHAMINNVKDIPDVLLPVLSAIISSDAHKAKTP